MGPFRTIAPTPRSQERLSYLGVLDKTSVFPPVFFIALTPLPHSQHFWHQRCGVFPHANQFSVTQQGVLQFNSILTPATRDSVRSHRLRAQSHETAPTPPIPTTKIQMPITSSRPPGYPHLLSDLATNWRFPWRLPPWIQLFARVAHRTQRHIYLHLPIY